MWRWPLPAAGPRSGSGARRAGAAGRGLGRPPPPAPGPQGPFPPRAAFHEHTPETVLERVLEPVAKAVLAVSSAARRLQHGRLHAYILYLMTGLAVLAALTFFWGR